MINGINELVPESGVDRQKNGINELVPERRGGRTKKCKKISKEPCKWSNIFSTERQTDRLTDRQTDRATYRQTE